MLSKLQKIRFLIGFFLILALVISCVPPQEKPTTTPSQPKTNLPSGSEPAAPAREAEPVMDPQVASLLAKGNEKDNYKYVYHSRIRNVYGNYKDEPSYELYTKEGKARKIYVNPQKLGLAVFYDEVYLDLEKRTARGICVHNGIICRSLQGKAYQLDYAQERPSFLPHEIVDKVGSDVQMVGKETFDNRDLTVVEFTNEQGQKERLSLDNYYGLPLKRIVYITEDDEEIILEEYSFTRLELDNVKNAEVAWPEGYALVE